MRRSGLFRLLDDALDREVIFIAAPAGYGKSTVVAEWLRELGLPYVWLTLDREDRDPRRLLSDLTEALRARFGGRFPAALLEAGPVDGDVPLRIGELMGTALEQVDEPFLIVMDDLNVLEGAEASLESVNALGQALALNVRLVVLSRPEVGLDALPRMVAQRRACFVGAHELAMDEAESVELLRRAGVEDRERQRLLMERADGWVAALAVLAEYDRRGAHSGADEADFVLEEFIEREVLTCLSEGDLALLEACSIVESFDLEMLAALYEPGDISARLHRLIRSTRLIASFEASDWYRVHALLRSYLLERMQRLCPQRLQSLRLMAREALLGRRMNEPAVELALEAGDWQEAARIAETLVDGLWRRGEWDKLAEWCNRLPEEVRRAHPKLLVALGRALVSHRKAHEALEELRSVEAKRLDSAYQVRAELCRARAFSRLYLRKEAENSIDSARASLGESRDLKAEVLLEEGELRGLIGEHDEAERRFSEAIGLLGSSGSWHSLGRAWLGIGNVLGLRGELHRAIAAYEKAQNFWRKGAAGPLALLIANNLASIHFLMGEWTLAQQGYLHVLKSARPKGALSANIYEGLANVARATGQLEDASRWLTETRAALGADRPDPVLDGFIAYAEGMIAIEQGRLVEARQVLQAALERAREWPADFAKAKCETGLGALMLAEGDHDGALRMLADAQETADRVRARPELAIIHLFMAAAHLRAGDEDAALEHLRQQRGLVAEIGYDAFLVAEARLVPDLLDFAAERADDVDYVRELRARVPPVQVDLPPAAPHARIRVEAFGLPRVIVEGREISDLEWRSERAKEMLILLLLEGRALSKEEVAAQLWPDLEPARLNSTFHSTLYRLRRAVDRDIVLRVDRGYELSPTVPITVDAAEFAELLEAAGQAIGAERSRLLQAAVELYRGPFASGWESEWVAAARQDYEDRYLGALCELADLALERREHDRALSLAERALKTDPLSEQAVRIQLAAHAARGQPDLVTRAFRRFHRAIEHELGEQPSPALRAAYERAVAERPPAFDAPSK